MRSRLKPDPELDLSGSLSGIYLNKMMLKRELNKDQGSHVSNKTFNTALRIIIKIT